jgi:hypothetical protein
VNISSRFSAEPIEATLSRWFAEPSSTELTSCSIMSRTDLSASSLPGITMSTEAGSQSVSRIPITATPIRRASRTAFASRAGSTTTIAPGIPVISRMPPRLRVIFRRMRRMLESIFFESWELLPSSSIFSSSSRRLRRLRMTEKFVSVPPIQRSVTTGMPVRWPASWMTPFT